MNTYQLIPHNGELFIWLQCDLDMALTIEKLVDWKCGEPVNTDDGFLYLVNGDVTSPILDLINYGFEEVRQPLAIMECMGERLTLHTDGSHTDTLQSTHGWSYGSPYLHSNRVAMYELEDNDAIFSELKQFMTDNGLKVIEW